MALFYDPITDEAGPSRTWEEDEEEFEELYGTTGQAAYAVKFLPTAEQQCKAGRLSTDLLLVGASLAGGALLSELGQLGDQIGSIVQEQKETEESERKPNQEKDEGRLFVLRAAERVIVVVSAPEGVRPEGAVAWARALLGGVSPARTVVFGSIPRSKFLGAADEGAPPVIYTVETSAQRAATRQAGTKVAYLPTGNLVDGVAAAVISHCQVRHLAATLLVNVDQTSGPDQRTLHAVAQEIRRVLEPDLDVQWSELVANSHKELARRARGQSWSELYS